eukprot:7355021-Prymnesium_polylepis.1
MFSHVPTAHRERQRQRLDMMRPERRKEDAIALIQHDFPSHRLDPGEAREAGRPHRLRNTVARLRSAAGGPTRGKMIGWAE